MIAFEAQRDFEVALLSLRRLRDNACAVVEHARTVEKSLTDSLRYNVTLQDPRRVGRATS